MVVDYVYRRGHFVVVLAVASQTWDWADARGCHPEVVREGVSVSVYVDACVVYGFVVDSTGFVGCFACGALVVVPAALASPCILVVLSASPPVRSGTFLATAAMKAGKRAGSHRWLMSVHPCHQTDTAQDRTRSRTTCVSDKAPVSSDVGRNTRVTWSFCRTHT